MAYGPARGKSKAERGEGLVGRTMWKTEQSGWTYLFGELRWDRYAWWVDGTPVASAYHS